jgi:hypothetical protein
MGPLREKYFGIALLSGLIIYIYTTLTRRCFKATYRAATVRERAYSIYD